MLNAGIAASPQTASTPTDALKAVVRELADEAEAIVANKDVPKGKPDYAMRCTHSVTPEEIALAIAQRTSRDAFVDAYIRWQLTSFDVSLPEMDDRAFMKFLAATPRMAENPACDADVVEIFERAGGQSRLPPRDLERLRSVHIELEKRTKIAELMNRPAMEFREWVEEKLGETGVRPRLWLLEECVATIEAGWPTRSIKTRISKSFLQAANEADFPREHLRLLAEQLQKLEGLERRYVGEVTFLVAGSVEVTISKAAVTETDIEKWTNRLAGVP